MAPHKGTIKKKEKGEQASAEKETQAPE